MVAAVRRQEYIGTMPHLRSWVVALAAAAALNACDTKGATKSAIDALWSGGPKPDELPVMLNKELPFKYPIKLYAQKVQGNVTLRIFIDSNGVVRPESTLVVETSGYAALDSAAIRGSQELRFVPAKLRGEPLAVPILFPVFFRHPEATPLPGDTILKQRASKPGE